MNNWKEDRPLDEVRPPGTEQSGPVEDDSFTQAPFDLDRPIQVI